MCSQWVSLSGCSSLTSSLTSDLPASAGSFASISPAGSLSGRPLQVGEAPSSPRYSCSEPLAANGGVMFEAPELPEETLMEVRERRRLWRRPALLLTAVPVCQQQEHTDAVQSLRFMLDFARCLVEVAGTRGAGVAEQDGAQSWTAQQQQSLVADQISSLSCEWR